MNKIKYLNIVNEELVEITDSEYQQFLTPLSLKINLLIEIFKGFKLDIIKKIPKSNVYFINFLKNDQIFRFYVSYLKNSGTKGNNNKRLQIPKNIPNFDSKGGYYCLGIYPTGKSKHIFLLSDITSHAQRSKSFTSYSSFWSHFKDILVANKTGKFQNVVNEIHHHFYFNDANLDYGYESLLKLINGQIENQNKFEKDFFKLKLFDASKVNILDTNKLERDNLFRVYVLNRDGYSCKLCKTSATFKDRLNKEYFEAHHIIPYNLNSQEHYKISLDHPDNMVTLCPTCHRQIHNSNKAETVLLLKKLINSNSSFINSFFKDNSIEDLVKFYFN